MERSTTPDMASVRLEAEKLLSEALALLDAAGLVEPALHACWALELLAAPAPDGD